MEEKAKTLLEVQYRAAFDIYNKKEKEFFSAFNSERGDWIQSQKEMMKAWKEVSGIIQKMIEAKNGVQGRKKKA
jgi:hypothetical protein